jgi:hypothetical protein
MTELILSLLFIQPTTGKHRAAMRSDGIRLRDNYSA